MSNCISCGKPKAPNSKYYCSYKCYRATLKGEGNPVWKGDGVHPFAGNGRARSMYPLEPCEICESEKSERHHVDGNSMNNERSNIQFLCRKHHMQIDGRPTGVALGGSRLGENHSNAKLTEAEVLQIRSEPLTPTVELTKRYNVHRNTIRAVLTGTTWKHLL